MALPLSISVAISYLRVLAIILIVICHLLQALDNRWAWVLNVGVQIFFFISGFLYGEKRIASVRSFAKSRFIKVYLPYAIYITMVFAFLFAVDNGVSIKQFIGYYAGFQGFAWGGVKGLGHLWFLSIIAICYLVTPIAQYLSDKNIWLEVIFACFFILMGLVCFPRSFWVGLYLISYTISRSKIYLRHSFLWLSAIVLFATALPFFSWEAITTTSYYSIAFHTLLAVSICLTAIRFMQLKHLPKYLELLDKYSYEIYLVHHFFILSYYTLMFVSGSLALNIFIILLLTITSAILLKKLSAFLSKVIA